MPEPGARTYGLRPGAEEFPLMVVISIIYPCNYGCPNCPYTDGNSEIRQFYHERDGDLFPVPLWNKIADECGAVRRVDALHRRRRADAPSAHGRHDRVRQGPGRARLDEHQRQHVRTAAAVTAQKLERLLEAGIDLIEFSMDAADAETYALVRPPHGGPPRNPQKWWNDTLEQRAGRAGDAERAPRHHARRRLDHPAGAHRGKARRGDQVLDRRDRRRRSDHAQVSVVGRQHDHLARARRSIRICTRPARPSARSRACGRSSGSTSIRSVASRSAGRTSRFAPRRCSRT